ncbi:MAG: hypothetical protein HY905_19555 [Deltaproteobacteria bacterium]|nr:hypothetical protein [Deltaproteobacteria bacterium]
MTHTPTPDASPPPDAGAPEPEAAAPPAAEPPVEFGPCMNAHDVLRWAQGHGAQVVAEALARYLTDLTPADIPEIDADRAAAWIRSWQAAPLADPECASLVVSFWFDPRTFLTADAGSGPAEAVALFSPALTEPAVAFAFCVDGRETCRVLRLEDLDADGMTELLLERTALDSNRPSVQVLYEFLPDSDPNPVWISDDDAVRRALFGAGGDTDPRNQAVVTDVSFDASADSLRLSADYQLVDCPTAPADPCVPSTTSSLVFSRLGDVYLLPDEPEPGAPWGRPNSSP